MSSCAGDLLCVLTYGDGKSQGFAIAINYTLLLTTGVLFIFGGRPKRRALLLLFFLSFQLGLCYAIGCVGVSTVWGACISGAALDQHDGLKLSAFRIVYAAATAALIYYALVAEAITDVAHVCAITMGFIAVQADEALLRRLERDADYEVLPPGTPRARML